MRIKQQDAQKKPLDEAETKEITSTRAKLLRLLSPRAQAEQRQRSERQF
jgi:hypothetical protein